MSDGVLQRVSDADGESRGRPVLRVEWVFASCTISIGFTADVRKNVDKVALLSNANEDADHDGEQ